MAQSHELRKRLNEKDNELNHLNEVNVKLKEKILEFQSYNQQNLGAAKAHIQQLTQTLEETKAVVDKRAEREQELEKKITKMKSKWSERQASTQLDIHEEKAIRFSELQIQRRNFHLLMKNILVCACARRIRLTIAQRESNYMKLVCFLYLKQEMALSKHVAQMKRRYQSRLSYRVI